MTLSVYNKCIKLFYTVRKGSSAVKDVIDLKLQYTMRYAALNYRFITEVRTMKIIATGLIRFLRYGNVLF